MREPALMLVLLMAAASGAGVALCREPRRQVMAIGVNGLVLTTLFMLLQAPDVALSEVVIGTAALPLLYLAVIVSIRTDRLRKDRMATSGTADDADDADEKGR